MTNRLLLFAFNFVFTVNIHFNILIFRTKKIEFMKKFYGLNNLGLILRLRSKLLVLRKNAEQNSNTEVKDETIF